MLLCSEFKGRGGNLLKDRIIISLPCGTKKEMKSGITVSDALKALNFSDKPLITLLNEEEVEPFKVINRDSILYPVALHEPLGERTYIRSLCFLLVKAVNDVFKGARVTIEHTLNKGLYGEIYYDREISERDIETIKNKMIEIVSSDEKIEKIKMKKNEAIDLFQKNGYKDKVRLLKYMDFDEINVYKCGTVYDYFYGPMLMSMGGLKVFDIIYYKPGFILLYPGKLNDYKITPFIDLPKLGKVFKETEDWAKILDVADVGSLNDKVVSGEFKDIVLVAEGFHEKKIANIADKIYENRDKVKIVLIAGPSSSGKTTFSKRLSIQLRVLGLKPIAISLDDYFLSRDKTPKDKDGKFDFESIYALDLTLFNEQLTSFLDGNEIELPKFNFIKGKREQSGKKIRMEKDTILVIEGIHGLNETLTSSIPRENKFKIYISALTQLNIDDHNRIPTTDVRILRRIIRDSMTRGKSAEATIAEWPKVRAGEEKNIFPYQEEADIMFNSTLVYEMSVLRKYAEPVLKKIPRNSPSYVEARRLLIFLRYFKQASDDIVPKNSIIREFIGGGCFEI